jgi:hypothetical protein
MVAESFHFKKLQYVDNLMRDLVIRLQLNWFHNEVIINELNSDVTISRGELHGITKVANLTRTNIDPSVGGSYRCSYGASTSDPIIVNVVQKYVGNNFNRKSQREFLAFNLTEKIIWFKTLSEKQHFELRSQFDLSQTALNDLKQRAAAEEFVSKVIELGKVTFQLAKDFDSLWKKSKHFVLLDEKISPVLGEDLLEKCENGADVLTDEIADKLAVNCDTSCQKEKENAYTTFWVAQNQSMEFFDKETERVEEKIDRWSKTSESLDKTKDITQTVKHPDNVHKELTRIIENAYNNGKGFLSKAIRDKMLKMIDDSTEFDPSLDEIRESVEEIRRINKARTKSLYHFGNIRNGIRSMSSIEKVAKISNALESLASAIGKYQSSSKQIMKGILDTAGSVAEFLPAPATVVTSSMSKIYNTFLQSPYVKENFENLKEFTRLHFEKQNKFVQDEYEKQSIFIQEDFRKQKDFIDLMVLDTEKRIQEASSFNESDSKLDKTAEQNDIMIQQFREEKVLLLKQRLKIDEDFHQLQNSLAAGINDLKSFIEDREMVEISSNAEPLLEKLDYLGFVIKNVSANEIQQNIDVLGATEEIQIMKKAFESKCIDSHVMKCDQNTLQKSICTKTAYIIFSTEKFLDTTLLKLINLLQTTDLKSLNENYLITQVNRRNDLKEWISKNLISNKDIACPVFKRRTYYWGKPEYFQDTLDFFTYLDPNLVKMINEISLQECQSLEKAVLKQCCACNQMGSAGTETCDYFGQCQCKEGYDGRKCDRCHHGYFRPNMNMPCQSCQCSPAGSSESSCSNDGKCSCKPLFEGDKCDRCQDRFYFSQSELNCQECSCNIKGITKQSAGNCDDEGQCDCKNTGFLGKTCHSCLDGYYGSDCTPCNCYEKGSRGKRCNKSNGKCSCSPGYKGIRCNECEPGYYKSGSECKKCQCDINGGDSGECDDSGQCYCNEGFKGRYCNSCKDGYYGAKCSPCNCHKIGSKGYR